MTTAQEQDVTAPPDDLRRDDRLGRALSWEESVLPLERETPLPERLQHAGNWMSSPRHSREAEKYAMRAIDDAERSIATLTAENKALREALRELAIDSAGFETATGWTWQQCLVCSCKWATGDPEEHTDGCLAAGAANER